MVHILVKGEHLFHALKFGLKFILSFQKLIYELVFTPNFFSENRDNIVFALKHILQVSGQGIKAIVRVLLRLLFYYRHSTLPAGVRPRTLLLLVVHYVHSLHFSAAIDAGHKNIGADRLMLLYIFSNALSFAD